MARKNPCKCYWKTVHLTKHLNSSSWHKSFHQEPEKLKRWKEKWQTIIPTARLFSLAFKNFSFRYIKIQSNTINLSTGLWGTDAKLGSYSPESRAEVYRFRLDFNVLILVSKSTQLLQGHLNWSIVDSLSLSCFVISLFSWVSHLHALVNEVRPRPCDARQTRKRSCYYNDYAHGQCQSQ